MAPLSVMESQVLSSVPIAFHSYFSKLFCVWVLQIFVDLSVYHQFLEWQFWSKCMTRQIFQLIWETGRLFSSSLMSGNVWIVLPLNKKYFLIIVCCIVFVIALNVCFNFLVKVRYGWTSGWVKWVECGIASIRFDDADEFLYPW